MFSDRAMMEVEHDTATATADLLFAVKCACVKDIHNALIDTYNEEHVYRCTRALVKLIRMRSSMQAHNSETYGTKY